MGIKKFLINFIVFIDMPVKKYLLGQDFPLLIRALRYTIGYNNHLYFSFYPDHVLSSYQKRRITSFHQKRSIE